MNQELSHTKFWAGYELAERWTGARLAWVL